MSPRIYVTRRISEEAFRVLEGAGGTVMWDELSPVPRDELLRQVAEVNGLLITADERVDRELLQAAPQLRVVSTISSGVDHIDLELAAARGVTVCHTPGAANDAVAEFTIGLLFACARQIPRADAFVHAGDWHYWSPETFLGAELSGSVLGIIGLGQIGREVARRADALGMRVFYYDTRRNRDAEAALGISYCDLDALLGEGDYLTLHVPLLPATRHLINAARLRLMKPTAYLINMARGPVVEEAALVRALRGGWIAGAALDVFEEEPLPADSPLLGLPNVILTPHIGANSRRAMTAMMRTAAVQLMQVLRGERPANIAAEPGEERKAA